jgi:tRNA A-37 threonylcarbamoyl transferase component Bud32
MRPGYRIGNYVLIEQIGQGGQAAVWSADDEQLKRMVAVKTINLAASDNADKLSPEAQAERFRHEAELIADLEHPFILPIYAFGQEGAWLYLIMRYMAGGTLKKLLQIQPMDLARVVAIARPLADALDAAHQKKIVHRDIKSANILIDSRQNAYLADFGLSVTAGAVDISGFNSSGAGTLAYMSPEQMRSEPVDPRSDIYAFGILLFEMLTGSVPLVKNQPWNLQQLTNGTPLPLPESLPRALGAVLRRATAFDLADRYATATEIVDELARIAAQQTVPEQPSDQPSDDLIIIEDDTRPKPQGPLPVTDPAMLALMKAHEMFEAALADWADGAGRFHLDADDFQYIDSFYSAGDSWGLNLDEAARRMLLRAALEHGYNLELWWEKETNPDQRRSVAMQALSGQIPAARLRAMQYLATVEDSDPPAIPVRVVNIVRKEPEAAVRLAGVKLLEGRANPASTWRAVAYDETIDNTLAELAAHDPDPAVAEEAARACARLYSETAVARLGKEAADNRNALQALTYARDEVPAFPASVPAPVRRRAFVLLSIRQFFGRGLMARYAAATLAFAVGWGVLQYVYYPQIAAQAIGNAATTGVLYGLLIGLGILAAVEPAERLRAWTRPGRIALSILGGGALTTLAFLAIRRFYYYSNEDINWLWLAGPSAIFVAGFAISSGLTRHPLARAILGALGVLVGLWGAWIAYLSFLTADPLIVFRGDDPGLDTALTVVLALAVGLITFLPEWLRMLRQVTRRII